MQEGEAQSVWDAAKRDELLDGMSRMEFTLRYTFSHPHLHTTIVGTVSPDHLGQNVAALADDLYAEANRRLAEAGSTPAGA